MQALKEHFRAGEWRFELMRNELDLVLFILGYLTYCIGNVQQPLALYILLLNQLLYVLMVLRILHRPMFIFTIRYKDTYLCRIRTVIRDHVLMRYFSHLRRQWP